jgi:hypothetical protein
MISPVDTLLAVGYAAVLRLIFVLAMPLGHYAAAPTQFN